MKKLSLLLIFTGINLFASAQNLIQVKDSAGNIGYKDKSGKLVIPYKYRIAGEFSEGLAYVWEKEKGEGFINNQGEVVIPLMYEDTQDFHEGVAAVKLNKKWGYVDKSGKQIVPFIYSKVGNFSEGLAYVALVYGEGYGYINQKGEMVIPVQFKSAYPFSDGVAMVDTKQKWAQHIDKTGKILEDNKTQTSTTTAQNQDKPVQNLYIGYKNGLFGYSDNTGAMVIPYKYTQAGRFSEGLAHVWAEGKGFGYIDSSDKLIIPYSYENAQEFYEGLAAVKIKDKWGYIDKKGNQVISPMYDKVDEFREGLVAVKLNGNWGYIDKKGSQVVPFEYNVISPFSQGLAAVFKYGQGFGYIDNKGKVVIPLQYKTASVFATDGTAKVGTATKEGLRIDKMGKLINDESQITVTKMQSSSPEQACLLAAQLLKSQGSKNEAIALLRKYDKKGNIPSASYYLAQGFQNGQINAGKKEIDSAIYYYQKAATQGYQAAMYPLGLLYEYATGNDYPTPVAQNMFAYLIDNKKARYWYNEFAKTGNQLALIKVNSLDKVIKTTEASDAYAKGYDAFDAKNYEEAYRWWKISAFEGNNASAYFGLAILHHLGKAPNNSYTTAMEYYQKAADMGIKDALTEKQKIKDYLNAVELARQKAATAATTTSRTSSGSSQGESYDEWWQKTYGKGGTQNSSPMPNNNIPQATYRTGKQSESDRHQQAMDALQRSIERQQSRDYTRKNQ
ncbi:SEL1-like repeat protein [Pedobacter aquatilis]|uniref:SEL1-like repeat protein n=1 Tax=Pedobacter aquatilis TaxID=351343 RepID=UPI002931E88A|nr:SEL1-like repeat protein [Pedobacter aquatilis]